MAQTETQKDLRERPIRELFKQLAQEMSTLIRQEIDLAKAELGEKGRKAGIGAGILGAAGILGLLAAGALTAFLILALDTFMPAWSAALIVAVVYAAIAGVLYLQGRKKLDEAGRPVPGQTVETVKEDVEWAKSQVKSGGN